MRNYFGFHFFVLQQFWENQYPSSGFSIQFSIFGAATECVLTYNHNDLSRDIRFQSEMKQWE